VNIGARVGAAARPGEVLVSKEVVEATTADGDLAFSALGLIELKGAPGPMELFVARKPGA